MNLHKALPWLLCVTVYVFGVDPLPSWHEGAAKKAILDFVAEVTNEKCEHYVPETERIAVFDQDGTLWVEQPDYVQGFFAMERVKELAHLHLEWKETMPFKAILENSKEAIGKFSEQEIAAILSVTHAGMSVDQFQQAVKDWLAHAEHPRFKKPFTELVYQPMLEVIELLRENGFSTYIVSGGGQEFIRVYAEKVYGIPPEKIIGTAGKVNYEYNNGNPRLLKLPKILLIDDKKGKPEAINLFIGKRPVAAFGNSTGDREMLEWTHDSSRRGLSLLVHHDDPVREYAYDTASKIGRFTESLMQEAKKNEWIVVSMKNDWKIIFPFENK